MTESFVKEFPERAVEAARPPERLDNRPFRLAGGTPASASGNAFTASESATPRPAHHAAASLAAGGRVVIPELELALTPWRRMRGLLGRGGLAPGCGMYLAPAGSIHTWCMRFDLDLVFLSRELRVVRLVRGVRPFRMVFGGRGARGVVEVAAGWLDGDALRIGDAVEIRAR